MDLNPMLVADLNISLECTLVGVRAKGSLKLRNIALNTLVKGHGRLRRKEFVVARVQSVLEGCHLTRRENCLPRVAAGICLAVLERKKQRVETLCKLHNVVRATLGLLAVQVEGLERVSLRIARY